MTELTSKEKRAIMIDRFNKMSNEEYEYYCSTSYHSDISLRQAIMSLENGDEAKFNNREEYFWEYCILGKMYSLFENDNLENLEKRLSAIEQIYKRKRWGSIRGQDGFKALVANGKVTPLVFAMYMRRFSQEDKNIFETYMKDPMFNVGQIVQLRANAGTDSVLTTHEYQHTSKYYYGCGARELCSAKKKTFMVIGVDPKLEGTIYAKAYKYKEKQGGCRYYKLLPMGEQKTYIVVEKFMKKCRTRAIKDARK